MERQAGEEGAGAGEWPQRAGGGAGCWLRRGQLGPAWGGESRRTWLSAPQHCGFVRAGAGASGLEPSPPSVARRQGGKEGGAPQGGRRRWAGVTLGAPELRLARPGSLRTCPEAEGVPGGAEAQRRRGTGRTVGAQTGVSDEREAVGKAGGDRVWRQGKPSPPCTRRGGRPLPVCRFPGGADPAAAGREAGAVGARRGGNARGRRWCGGLAPELRWAAAKRSAAASPPPPWAPGAAPAERVRRGRRGSLGPERPGAEDETAGEGGRASRDRTGLVARGATPRLESWGAGCE